MATVRFSHSLKADILQNAKNTFHPKLRKLHEEVPEYIVGQAWNAFFDPYREKARQIPAGFLRHIKGLSIVCEYSDGNGDNSMRGMLHDAKCACIQTSEDIRTERFYMNAHTGYGTPTLRVLDVPENEELITPVKEHFQKRFKLEQTQKDFVDNVDQILNNFATLAPALKQWPPLWELLPDETKERHKEVKETKRRKPKDIEELGLDIGKMSSTVVASKLSKK